MSRDRTEGGIMVDIIEPDRTIASTAVLVAVRPPVWSLFVVRERRPSATLSPRTPTVPLLTGASSDAVIPLHLQGTRYQGLIRRPYTRQPAT